MMSIARHGNRGEEDLATQGWHHSHGANLGFPVLQGTFYGGGSCAGVASLHGSKLSDVVGTLLEVV